MTMMTTRTKTSKTRRCPHDRARISQRGWLRSGGVSQNASALRRLDVLVHLPNRRGVILTSEDRRPRHERIGARRRDRLDVIDLHAAVDLQAYGRAPTRRSAAAPPRFSAAPSE